ncbi:glycosyltransferase [Paenibacillus sp. 7523-1]|uniref:glycosyltransferase n=1 Tax=Paenibacillus sp. 7523-1 TaxID=2022550 RepID=UPI000BA635EB|nr:glycosyltransferase [Paenibacillus sp. 7523-1]PAD30657.1 hypothetical protein CHH60_15070 [Paenibacillus sp. 7523-1]
MNNESQELEELKRDYKDKIRNLIESNDLIQASYMIEEYEKINVIDSEILCFRGIIQYLQGNLEYALSIFKKGINLDSEYFDLLFNIAITNESLEKYNEAYRYYDKALLYCTDSNLIEFLKEKTSQLYEYKQADSSIRKKVLIIAHIFPPLGGSGVQRTLKFVKYLREEGWEPVIVTTGASNYPYRDETLLSEIPEGTEVIRVDEPPMKLDQKQLNNLIACYNKVVNKKEIMDEFLSKVKSDNIGLLQPDEHILWGINVIEEVKKTIDISEMELVYTTGAPFTDHVIGYLLKKELNKPWIADFRDEWTNNAYQDYDEKDIIYKIKYCMEENIVSTADKIITTTPYATHNFITRFQLNESKVITITNGYDEDDFLNIKEQISSNDKFRILHNGLLYLIRTPLTFMTALFNLINSGKIPHTDIEVGFTWSRNNEIWQEAAEKFGLQDVIKFYDYLSHHDSLKLANEMDLLLLIVGPGEKNRTMYPGKVFEYLRLNKNILSLSPKDSLVELLLEETGRGVNVKFEEIAEIERSVLYFYEKWKSGKMNEYRVTSDIAIYERRNQTKLLAATFNRTLVEYEELNNRQKICFFSHKDGDKFLNDIMKSLSETYYVRKIIVEDAKQLEEGMKWADLCWFEWCDNIFAAASNLPIAKEKKLICRIHRYEVFTDNPKKVAWENVDKLIIVTEHLKNLLCNKVPNIEKLVDIITIHNGVNLERYKYGDKKTGFNIAFIGYLNSRKNPMLLLQIAKEVVNIDPKYKFFIAGDFQDEVLELYWNHMVIQLGLEDNVVFQGYQVDIKNWLEDKNYILSTTMHESFGYGIAEAMAMGIKPVIHNFVFSQEVWPEEYIFNTVHEAVSMIIEENYNSEDYHKFIADRYSLANQIREIQNVVAESMNSPLIKTFNYNSYWQNRLNEKFNIESVGYQGLGIQYNTFMYQSRFEILEVLITKIFGKSLNTKSILELGPGIGVFTDYFKKKGVTNYNAIDITDRSIENLSQAYPEYNFKKGDVSSLDYYPSQKADLIFAADVLLHITNERNFQNTISNISGKINDQGYVILFDAYSETNAKSKNSHLVIRDIRYINDILETYDLEVVNMIPVSMFTNNPFDASRFKDKEKLVLSLFDMTTSIFLKGSLSTDEQNALARWLFNWEKKLLLNHRVGSSQKALLIKKKNSNGLIDVSLEDIWSTGDIEEHIKRDRESLSEFSSLSNMISDFEKLLYLF